MLPYFSLFFLNQWPMVHYFKLFFINNKFNEARKSEYSKYF